MEKRKAGWKQKLGLFVFSCMLIVGLLCLGELYCRLFTRINFLDNSRGLFTYNRYGNTYGNTPNFEGISFGETFYTDADGFRIDTNSTSEPPAGAPAILVMGDSVAFGPALTEDKTISGNLRRLMPDVKIYNGAAVGYDTFDYKNAVAAITADRPEITTVLLFFCLNDVSDASAQSIRSQSERGPLAETGSDSMPKKINNYLRSRSKLFIWLKNALIDTQMNYFNFDRASYQRGEENVNAALRPIVELKRDLDGKGVSLKIFITPYEAQLRANMPADAFEPQKLVTDFLQKNGLEVYDTTPDFQTAGSDTNLLFLYGDPMHLSDAGTKLVAEAVCRRLETCEPN